MSEVVFVNMRNDDGVIYPSYKEEYYRLVELSGFRTIELNEIEYDKDYYVIISPRNGNTNAHFDHIQAQGRKCTLVYWALEWPTYRDGVLEGAKLEPYWDLVLVSDKHLLSVLKKENPEHNIKYIIFGGHKDFGGEHKEEMWDFVTLAYAYGTRAHKMEILASNGYSFAPSQISCWGEEKKKALSRARWGLCLHQFGVSFLNVQRLTLFASWKLPIISDYCVNPYPYKIFPDGLVHFDPRNTICGNRSVMREAAEYNHYLVTQLHTFKSEVDKITSPKWYHD